MSWEALSDTLLALVPVHGVWIVSAITFLSCLALPVPSSLAMLAAGGFVAAGDLSLWAVAGGAFAGAVLGDQTGYWLGRRWGPGLVARLARAPRRAAALARAEAYIERNGSIGIFFSRWLVSPLGPYVNLAAGAARFGWRRFLIAGVPGEAVWVAIYVGLGFAFAGNIEAAESLIGSVLGFAAAGAVTVGLGLWLWRRFRRGPSLPVRIRRGAERARERRIARIRAQQARREDPRSR